MSEAIAEHAAQNQRADALMISLTQKVTAGDTAGISDVIDNAIDELARHSVEDRQEKSSAGTVDGSSR